jgi:DNA polymerase III psi subunit
MEPQLIRFIYKDELYRLEEKKSGIYRMLVAVDDNYDHQKELLDKILASVNLSPDDVEISKISGDIKISDLNFSTLISFGIKIREKPNLKPNSLITIDDKTIITAESLDTIANDSTNEHKKKLWSLLKNHFK